MPLRIRVSNLTRKRKINLALIKKATLHVLGSFKKNNATIDITFVSDGKIKALNKKYMKKEEPTDVLSFIFEKSPIPKDNNLMGDIYISSDSASENAKRFNTSFERELLLYAIHGTLHLLGFADKTANEKNKIRKLEEKFLTKLTSHR